MVYAGLVSGASKGTKALASKARTWRKTFIQNDVKNQTQNFDDWANTRAIAYYEGHTTRRSNSLFATEIDL